MLILNTSCSNQFTRHPTILTNSTNQNTRYSFQKHRQNLYSKHVFMRLINPSSEDLVSMPQVKTLCLCLMWRSCFYATLQSKKMDHIILRGLDRMVVGFTTACAISAYHTKVVSLNLVHSEVYLIQYYVIKFVSDFWQVCGFIRVLRFPPPIKLTTTI